jgi:hypothetical protein
MNKFVEAIRRLLLIITWLPTTISVGYILLNFNEVADAFYDDIPIFAGFIIVPLVVHYVINWIFQVNESGNNRNQQRVSEAFDDDYRTPIERAQSNKLVMLAAWGWFIGIIYLGYKNNDIPIFDFDNWISLERIIFIFKTTWIYMLIAVGGFILIQFIAEQIYKRR